QKEGLVDLLDGVLFLADAGGEGLQAHGTAVEAVDDGEQQPTVHGVEAGLVDLEPSQGAGGALAVDDASALLLHEVAHATQQAIGDAWRTAGAARDLRGALLVDLDAQDARGALHDLLQLLHRVEIESLDDGETIAQRARQKPGAGGGADEGEARKIDAQGTCRRPGIDDDVEAKVLHRRVEALLHRRREPVDLVDEEDVAGLE